MALRKKRSRLVLGLGAFGVIAAALTAAFWPRTLMVDMDLVTRGAMMVTIDEQGLTRVRDAYVVSTPVAGRLQRIQVHPGDQVVRGSSIVAHMLPTNPAALDIRTREQASALVDAAEAALRVAKADLNAALANSDLAASELDRASQLNERGLSSAAALEKARQLARVAEANTDTTRAAISMRLAELANARAQLIGFDDQGLARAIGNGGSDDIPLYAPTDGTILRVIQESETTLPVGAPILEIGDIGTDLEIVVDLLSSDAVQVAPGDRVLVEDWGGSGVLEGQVVRVDPIGITKYSALGVQEQRVNTVISFTMPQEPQGRLGHGYRVAVRIVVWQTDDTLIVPAAALFREGEDWAVFLVTEGRAGIRKVEVGANNGIQAQVTGGLAEGDRVVLYPGAGLAESTRVAQRVLN